MRWNNVWTFEFLMQLWRMSTFNIQNVVFNGKLYTMTVSCILYLIMRLHARTANCFYQLVLFHGVNFWQLETKHLATDGVISAAETLTKSTASTATLPAAGLRPSIVIYSSQVTPPEENRPGIAMSRRGRPAASASKFPQPATPISTWNRKSPERTCRTMLRPPPGAARSRRSRAVKAGELFLWAVQDETGADTGEVVGNKACGDRPVAYMALMGAIRNVDRTYTRGGRTFRRGGGGGAEGCCRGSELLGFDGTER